MEWRSGCDIVLGTNALGSLGFNITNPNRATIKPAKVVKPPVICHNQEELLTLSTGPASASSLQQPPELSTEGQTEVFNVDPCRAKWLLNQARKGYYVMDEVLYYEGPDVPDKWQLVVPSHLSTKVINKHHDSVFTAGHLAAKKTAQRINQYYYWSGMKSQVCKKCKLCVTWASVRGQGHSGRPPLVSLS